MIFPVVTVRYIIHHNCLHLSNFLHKNLILFFKSKVVTVMKMGQMVLDVMTMGFAVVSLISRIISVISVMMVSSTFQHANVINTVFQGFRNYN